MTTATFECKHPDKNQSEDLVWFNGEYFLVMDGATPKNVTGAHEETVNFINEIKNNLINLLQHYEPESLVKLMREVCVVSNTYTFRPSATIVLCRLVGDSLEYFILGDSILFCKVPGGEYLITDKRLSCIAVEERETWRNTQSPDEKSQARDALIEKEVSFRNKEGGYWILDSEMNPEVIIAHAVTGKINGITSVLMSTDGIKNAFKLGLVSDYYDLYNKLLGNGKELIELMREEEDNHDDVSCIVLQL